MTAQQNGFKALYSVKFYINLKRYIGVGVMRAQFNVKNVRDPNYTDPGGYSLSF